MIKLLAELERIPDLPKIGDWMVWGPAGAFFCVGLIFGIVWFFTVTLPGAKKKQIREDKNAETIQNTMRTVSDSTRRTASSQRRQTRLMEKFDERLEQHGSILEQLMNRPCQAKPQGH